MATQAQRPLIVTCPACGKRVRPIRYTMYPHRHKNPAGQWCDGQTTETNGGN
jgi:hypothetical protein